MFDLLQGLKNKCFLIELPSHLWRTIDPYVLGCYRIAIMQFQIPR